MYNRRMAKTITLCASAAFYEHLNKVADDLAEMGYTVLVPVSASEMRKTGEYDVDKYKTWYDNKEDFHHKTNFLDRHIKEVEKADAILVINDQKKDIDGYIGFNVMIEMAVAYYLKKPIFVLNPVTDENAAYEEVVGMNCRVISGDLKQITFS